MFDCKRCGFTHGDAHKEDSPESCIRLLKDLLLDHDDSIDLLTVEAQMGRLDGVKAVLERRFGEKWLETAKRLKAS